MHLIEKAMEQEVILSNWYHPQKTMAYVNDYRITCLRLAHHMSTITTSHVNDYHIICPRLAHHMSTISTSYGQCAYQAPSIYPLNAKVKLFNIEINNIWAFKEYFFMTKYLQRQ